MVLLSTTLHMRVYNFILSEYVVLSLYYSYSLSKIGSRMRITKYMIHFKKTTSNYIKIQIIDYTYVPKAKIIPLPVSIQTHLNPLSQSKRNPSFSTSSYQNLTLFPSSPPASVFQ